MQNEKLRISCIQYDIAWENKSKNISFLNKAIADIAGKTDLVVLPEMFSTGFSSNASVMAEPANGETLGWIKQTAQKHDIAICGSLIIEDGGKYYNRAFFVTPTDCAFYDKRHLFMMGGEKDVYTAGDKKQTVSYKGFNIFF